MKRLSRKESMAIATIHEALRELRIRDRYPNVTMFKEEISISVHADTENEARALALAMRYYKDEDETIDVRKYEATEDCPEFWVVRLRKWMV